MVSIRTTFTKICLFLGVFASVTTVSVAQLPASEWPEQPEIYFPQAPLPELTVKGEAIMDLYYRSKVGNLAVVYDRRQVNGVAVTFILEQPFYKERHVSVGFRAAYSNFNWQLWSLYDTFDRNLFYPQLIFGFIL